MSDVYTTVSRIKDEFGGVFPRALIAVSDYSESSQITASSQTCVGKYLVDHEIGEIAYMVMYKYDESQSGMAWRQLKVMADGEVTTKLTVDLSKAPVISALQGVADPDERRRRAIFADLNSRMI